MKKIDKSGSFNNIDDYNLNGISRCFGIPIECVSQVYEEGERTNSTDYKSIFNKMKKRKSFQESIDTYTIQKISSSFGISQKYATKIFEEGKEIGSDDYEKIYSKMKYMRGMKMYITQLQNQIKLEKQGGK